MTKTELIKAIAEDAGLDKKTVTQVINSLTTVLTMAIAAGDRVTLPGLGVFEAAHREARTGRNPQTGEIITIPAWLGAAVPPRRRPQGRGRAEKDPRRGLKTTSLN